MTIPLLWPRDGARGSSLTNTLRTVLNSADTVPLPLDEPIAAYVRWATDAVQRLRPVLPAEDLDSLVRTPAYWTALAMSPRNGQGGRFVNDELDARRQDLRRVIESLEAFERHLSDQRPTTYVVPDTNVLLEHPRGLAGVDWEGELAAYLQPFDDVRVVIPLVVVDELDNLKRVHRSEKAARAALKAIYGYFGASVAKRPVLRGGDPDDGRVFGELLMEAASHTRLPRLDDELIRVASRLSSFTERKVAFLTYDTGAAFRAAAAGMPHVRLTHKSDL